ncbi:MAG: polymer-forming cytoskeletal protein [Verrucomicrobiia bacterium]
MSDELSIMDQLGVSQVGCFACGAMHELAPDVITLNCYECGKPIDLSSYKIESLFNRRIQTHGEVFITARGKYQASNLTAGRLVVEGILEASYECRELALGKVAHLAVAGKADRVVILPGARLRFSDFAHYITTTQIRVEGHLEVELLKFNGEVVVGEGGSLSGNLEVESLMVEKGGNFEGKLSVG